MRQRSFAPLGLVASLLLLLILGGLYLGWVWPLRTVGWQGVFGGVNYEAKFPAALGLILVAPLLIWVLSHSLAALPWPQRILSVVFRSLFFLALGCALSQPSKTSKTNKICTVLLIDVSDSVPDAALEDARSTISDLLAAKRPDDRVKIITFAARPRVLELSGGQALPSAGALRHRMGAVAGKKPEKGVAQGVDTGGSASNLQAALRLGLAVFPEGYLKRLLLLSDGIETEGALLSEIPNARAAGVKVSTQVINRPLPPEVAITELVLPAKVDIGQPFEIVASIFATQEAVARASLYQGETLNGLDAVRRLELRPGKNEVKFQSVVRVGGQVTYELRLDQVSKDQFSENNRFQATLEVPGRASVLYIEGQEGRAGYFSSALSAQQFDVDVRSPSGFPTTLAELQRFAFVVLSDVPKEQFSEASELLVERYVRDLGGGFLFAGGEAGFGLGGWGGSTLERLLPVRMDSDNRKENPSVALVLVIDRSGSMSGLPIEMAKAACAATVSTLEPSDLIEVIAFDSQPERYVRMQPARYRSRIESDISRIQPGGGTEIFRSLDMAYQDISVVQARRKHVILLTDGAAPTEGITELAQAMLAESITVTTVGLGEQANNELLKQIADAGGGRYHAVPDANSLPRVFAREAEFVARQAAIEEWFQPQLTGSADFLKGIAVGSLPNLHGYVATSMKPAPAQQILASDREEPILARGRVGLGWALAWTSDLKNLWAVDWLRWPGYSQFWGQLAREHMRDSRTRELPMQTEVIGGNVRATVDAFDADERFDNNLLSTLKVVSSAAPGKISTHPLVQSAPGRYEARFKLDGYGTFALHAKHTRVGRDGVESAVAESFGHVSQPYPAEYSEVRPDSERLARAALIGGGLVNPTAAQLFLPGSEQIAFHEEIWQSFVFLALACFLLDLLLRRVRLFDRKSLPVRSSPGLPLKAVRRG